VIAGYLAENYVYLQGYMIGFYIGLVVAAIAIIVTKVIRKKKGYVKPPYDERQIAVQGKAFKYSYFTLVILIFINVFINNLLQIEYANNYVDYMGIVFISTGFFVNYCILQDAYFTLDKKQKRTLILFIFSILLLNIAEVVIAATSNSLIVDGQIEMPFLNVYCGAMMISVLIAIYAKHLKEKYRGELNE